MKKMAVGDIVREDPLIATVHQRDFSIFILFIYFYFFLFSSSSGLLYSKGCFYISAIFMCTSTRRDGE